MGFVVYIGCGIGVVLEIGCGEGCVSCELKVFGYDVIVSDVVFVMFDVVCYVDFVYCY